MILKYNKSKELESALIEIINPNESNSIINIVYRHPCMDGYIFNENFLKPLLEKMENDNDKKYP